MKKIRKNYYIFDAIGAELFNKWFNNYINEYDSITVEAVFASLLFCCSGNNDKYDEEFKTIKYQFVGWDKKIPMVDMFKVQKSKYGKSYEFVLDLPDYKELC